MLHAIQMRHPYRMFQSMSHKFCHPQRIENEKCNTCVQCIWAQNFPSRNYSAANELPNNAVRALFVDSNNVLWIGTENGIVSKQNNIFQNENYTLETVQPEHIEKIRKWRNEQLEVLRQSKPISKDDGLLLSIE